MAEQDELFDQQPVTAEYNEDNIRHMDDMEHIRNRPGMYIGKLGDGSQADDGIYVLLKEIRNAERRQYGRYDLGQDGRHHH